MLGCSTFNGWFLPGEEGKEGPYSPDCYSRPVPPFCPQEEFGYNAETQKLLCKNGETLLGAVNFFVSSINTLVTKTMEDTLMTVKQYEAARCGHWQGLGFGAFGWHGWKFEL